MGGGRRRAGAQVPRRPWMAERGRLRSRRLWRLPLSRRAGAQVPRRPWMAGSGRRASRVDLSHEGRGGPLVQPPPRRALPSAWRARAHPAPSWGDPSSRLSTNIHERCRFAVAYRVSDSIGCANAATFGESDRYRRSRFFSDIDASPAALVKSDPNPEPLIFRNGFDPL